MLSWRHTLWLKLHAYSFKHCMALFILLHTLTILYSSTLYVTFTLRPWSVLPYPLTWSDRHSLCLLSRRALGQTLLRLPHYSPLENPPWWCFQETVSTTFPSTLLPPTRVCCLIVLLFYIVVWIIDHRDILPTLITGTVRYSTLLPLAHSSYSSYTPPYIPLHLYMHPRHLSFVCPLHRPHYRLFYIVTTTYTLLT